MKDRRAEIVEILICRDCERRKKKRKKVKIKVSARISEENKETKLWENNEMKDRRARIEMLILRDGDVFFLDLTLAWPKISLYTRKIERKESKSKSKSARNWREGKLWGNNEMKDRRAGIIEMLTRGGIFFLDLTLAWPKISVYTRKIERKKSKSKSKSARNWISEENPRGGEKVMGGNNERSKGRYRDSRSLRLAG